eukprot:1926981-Prymnesium_polylepis.1
MFFVWWIQKGYSNPRRHAPASERCNIKPLVQLATSLLLRPLKPKHWIGHRCAFDESVGARARPQHDLCAHGARNLCQCGQWPNALLRFMSDLWARASRLHLRAGRCRWAELQLVCRAERGTNVEVEQVVPASCGE